MDILIFSIIFDEKNNVSDKKGVPTVLGIEIILHVHHKYYIRGRKPWEYDDDALITLCNWCHWDIHQKPDSIVIFDEGIIIPQNLILCSRCGGAGGFPERKHVQQGICFRCKGNRFEGFDLAQK